MVQKTLPRLSALVTYVRDIEISQAFWARHFDLEPIENNSSTYRIGDITWQLLPGAQPCGTRGPHGALPAFRIDDFGAARGYLLANDIPIVFEEMIPGVSLLVFLDPDATPFELSQTTDPGAWDIADRRELRSRRRQDDVSSGSVRLGLLEELTIYTHDVTASGRFYRDILGLPVGLSFFGHIHLAAENCAVVLRATNWQCKTPHQHHATEPVFAFPDLAAVAWRLNNAGCSYSHTSVTGLDVIDPAGIRLHLQQEA